MHAAVARTIVPFALAWLFIAPAALRAAETERVRLTGLHLCCNGCVTALRSALEEVKGVSAVEVDRDEGRATFAAASDAVLKQAAAAVTEAGFHGKMTIGERAVALPNETLDEEAVANRVIFKGVHLCCGGCAKAIAKAFRDSSDVIAVDCDTKAGTVTLIGSKVNLHAARTTLNGAGYHGKLRR